MIQATGDPHLGNIPAFSGRQGSRCLINLFPAQAFRRNGYRLLIPINANRDSRWGVDYALQLQRGGRTVEVCLLNVGEEITQWEVLRLRTQAEIVRFQAERAQSFIDETSLPLLERNIYCRGFFRQGGVVDSILDVAEELGCNEIVMPRPHAGVFKLFSREIVGTAMRKMRDIPIVLVTQTDRQTGKGAGQCG